MPNSPSTPDNDSIQQVLVTPRHLAGGGDPAWVTVPLHRACGWSHGHDPLMPRVILSSPDQKAVLRLDPTPDGPWWVLQHAPVGGQRAWSASFGARTPVEIIAAVTDALTDPAPATAPAPDPYEPLRQAGWGEGRDDGGLASPDGIAHVEHFVHGATDCWFVKAAISEDPEGQIWRAYFSGETPPHLVAAFTRALSDQTPLSRDPHPLRVSAYGRRNIQLSYRQLPPDEVAFALERRVKALADRSSRPAPAPRSPNVPPPRRTR
ncbi:DUF317 domain-containing protein [Streptomyces sp. NPDC050161]|uniref:DUF317 domain-containing protein n=1 Tax=Streptomyces sp. NPDC050161 TaxID=3365604 RepID=UPI00378ED7EB